MVFQRRKLDGEDGTTFRITAASARSTSCAAGSSDRAAARGEPGDFRKPDLVDLAALDPTIKLDIRYATTNNFLGTPLYTSARAFMQRPAAEALVRVHQALAKQGYGLLDPRRLSALARHEDVLGRHAGVGPRLRRRPVARARSTTAAAPST